MNEYAASPARSTFDPDDVERALLLMVGDADEETTSARDATVLEDGDGGCWCFRAEERVWLRWTGSAWLESPAPRVRLAGPGWLRDALDNEGDLEVLLEQAQDESGDDDDEPAPRERGPDAIATRVREIREDWVAGRIDSAEAEGVLRALYVVDGAWRLWTVGVRSGAWYRLATRGWVVDSGRPTPPAVAEDAAARTIQAQAPLLEPDVPALPEPLRLESPAPAEIREVEPAERSVERTQAAKPVARRSHRTPLLVGTVLIVVGGLVAGALWLGDSLLLDVDTAYWRGENYRTGRDVARDPREARRWLEQAAEAGHSGALHSLGLMHRDGDGIPRDESRARRYFERATAKGHVGSIAALADMLERGRGGPVDLRRARELRQRLR